MAKSVAAATVGVVVVVTILAALVHMHTMIMWAKSIFYRVFLLNACKQ